jgi:hypothetical protein
MPHKRIPPVTEAEILEPMTESEMEFNRYKGHFTICQTLRDMYAIAVDEDMKYKCRLAMAMAKKMQQKLKYYKYNTVPKEPEI